MHILSNTLFRKQSTIRYYKQSESKLNMHRQMAVSSKRKVTLLQFLNSCKAHTILLVIIFQHRPGKPADPSATWKTNSQHFTLKVKSSRGKIRRICISSPARVLGFDLQTTVLERPHDMTLSHVQYHLTARRPVWMNDTFTLGTECSSSY